MSDQNPFDAIQSPDDEDLGANDGLFDGPGDGQEYAHPQREAKLVASVDDLKWDSHKGNDGGEEYFVAMEFEVFKVVKQGEHEPHKPDAEPTRPPITEGDRLQFYQTIPHPSLPVESYSYGQKQDWQTVIECAASIYAIPTEIMPPSKIGEMCEKNTAEDMLVGVDIDTNTSDEGFTYTSWNFFPVVQPDEDGETGKAREPMTEDEVRAILDA